MPVLFPEAEYRYPPPQQNRYELWYQCWKRSCLVYLDFRYVWKSDREVHLALDEAYKQNALGMIVTRKFSDSVECNNSVPLKDRLVFTICDFKPYEPHFNTDFPSINYEDLIEVKELKPHVKVVSFDGQQYVYKLMRKNQFQNTFEDEVENYRKLTGVRGLPVLRAVVQKSELIQGLLMSYIEGFDLWTAVVDGLLKDESVLLDITAKIVQVATNLENHDFYHEDLKCSNIVRQQSTGDIYFIDLGGGQTEGMYREERRGNPSDALFTLGRTLWELWVGDGPWRGAPLDRVRNETIREIIKDCEEGNVGTIAELNKKYFGRVVDEITPVDGIS